MREVKGFWSDTRGSAALEFVVLFAPLAFLIFTMGELGAYMARSVMLDRGVNIAMRDVRVGKLPGNTSREQLEALRTKICENAFLIDQCNDRLLVEVEELGASGAFGTNVVNCHNTADPELVPADKFTPPGLSGITVIRACLVSNPIFPGVGLGAKLAVLPDGNYAVVSRSAFLNEQ